MKNSTRWAILISFVLLLTHNAFAQDKAEAAKHEKKVRDMVAFLEYMLNTLGDSNTPNSDKDILITESFSKIFRDGKVQIEDDLDAERTVITNKDVQAYLKDVDFFFKHAKFEFNIDGITSSGTGDKLFYKVSLKRNLKGTSIDGREINKTIPRYIEINYNSKDQDLKIVSIYTNVFNEKEALTTWWKELSYEWQAIFRRKLNLMDSIKLDDIKAITAIDNLNLGDNKYIQSIEPLTQLLGLKALNLSSTSISDVAPLRNLTELVDLDLSNTNVEDISSLRYASSLEKLNISNTKVSDIAVAEKLVKLTDLQAEQTQIDSIESLQYLNELQRLNLKATKITSLAAVDSLTTLKELDVSQTAVSDLEPITSLSQLAILKMDSTLITDISPLSDTKGLKILSLNNTSVSSLEPLLGLVNLERVYCDHTKINQAMANAFMASKAKVLVISDSEDLRGWWEELTPTWQQIFKTAIPVSSKPTKDELAKLTNLDSIYIAGKLTIPNLKPLQKLQKLKVIIANNSGVSDLSPIKEHRNVKYIDISNTEVTDLTPLRSFSKLTTLRAEGSKIESLEPLYELTNLQRLYIDRTPIGDTLVRAYLTNNPDCLVLFKTMKLENWWNDLPEEWKQVFKMQTKINTNTRKEDFHFLIALEKIQFGDINVSDLTPLQEFIRLKELYFSGTTVNNLSPLTKLKSLRTLHVSDNPVQDISALAQLTQLEDLNISNSPVTDLTALSGLQNLNKLSCSGTQLKKLNGVTSLKSLEYLDCSNTEIKTLKPVNGLPLKTLKCYNTRVSKGQITKFKKANPDCQVVFY